MSTKKYGEAFFFVLSLVFVFCTYFTPETTNDFWLQLKVGDIIRETFRIPRTVLFSYTEAKNFPFIAHEWLPSCIVSWLLNQTNYATLIVFKGLLYSLSFFLAFSLARFLSGSTLLALMISILCLFTMSFRSFLRPEAFSYIFFLLELNLIYRCLQKPNWRHIVFLVLTNIFWANSHGSFLVGVCSLFVFYACQLITEKFKPSVGTRYLFWAGIFCALGSLVNPFGIHLIYHTLALSQSNYIKDIIFEWRPLFSDVVRGTRIFTLAMIFFVSAFPVLLWRIRKLNLASLAMVSLFTYLALSAQRHLAMLAIASVGPLALALKDLRLRPRTQQMLSGGFLALLISAFFSLFYSGNGVSVHPGWSPSARVSDEAIQFIKENKIVGNVLNTYTVGAQLVYHFYPEMQIVIDSRIDAYGEKYMSFYRGLWRNDYSALNDFLVRYNVRYIIVDPQTYGIISGNSLLASLTSARWKPIFTDQSLRIFSQE